MSDGGSGESSKEIKSNLNKKRRKNDEFAQAIAKIAVAQVCESVGFQGFQQSALDKLSDVTCKYIREIGKTSNFYANLAGRTECNVFDIIQGLEDLSISQGFAGASDRDHCLSGSGTIKEISQFVNLSEEIGFAYSIPSFPVVKERKSTPSFLQSGEIPPTEDIPDWLPKLPDLNTYTTSIPSASTEENQIIPDKIEQEQKIIKRQSSKLEHFWVRNESEFPAIVEQGENSGKMNNPFLAVPLQPGEKEISVISLPGKFKEENMVQNHTNHVLELDTFAPENQEIKANDCDTNEGSKKDVLNNTCTVKMKFQIGKKSTNREIIRHNEKGKPEVCSWFLNDEVSDEKERRTDKFVTEPMNIEENSENASESVVN